MTERPAILQEREKTHGNFRKNAQTWVKFKQVKTLYATDPVFHLSLDMIYLKLSRAIENPKCKDHWADIAGYAQLAMEACDD